jgi:hypothetical protein
MTKTEGVVMILWFLISVSFMTYCSMHNTFGEDTAGVCFLSAITGLVVVMVLTGMVEESIKEQKTQ